MINCELIQTFAALPKTERGQFIVLGGDPKNKNFLYTNGNSVIIRNIENPSDSDIYTQHSCRATVAKYSPSGFYIASGDMNGKVRIWDTTQKEHILKCEYQPISGKICDIAWAADNTKLAIGGQGREKFGVVINVDTGTNVGEVSGMAKCINNLDLKPNRPFKLATSSEDGVVAFLEGPPFKFKTNHQCHTNFANCLRYSPTGDYFVSAGADAKIFVFDGKTGENLQELGSPAHKGGIYAIAFNNDGSHLISAGGDKTLKVWQMAEPRGLVGEYIFGTSVDDIQVGCTWVGDKVISVSLSGDISIFNSDDLIKGEKPYNIVLGHQKPITALTYAPALGKLVSSDSEGKILLWDPATGKAEKMTKNTHSNQIQSIAINKNDVVSVGVDDKLIITDLISKATKDEMKLTSQPRKISIVDSLIAVACYKEIVLTNNTEPLTLLPVKYEPSCLCLHPNKSILVVGGEEHKIFVYAVASDHRSLSLVSEVSLLNTPRDFMFSADGSLLVCGDSDRKVSLFKVNNMNSGDSILTPAHNEHWKYHTGRVSCVAINSDSTLVASGSLDCSIIIWSVKEPSNKFIVKNAHAMSNITSLVWIDNHTLYSAGQDSNIKAWKVTFN